MSAGALAVIKLVNSIFISAAYVVAAKHVSEK
jgi:hypothetical protein